jgi:hypothetical protein
MKTKHLYGVAGLFLFFGLITAGCRKSSVDNDFIAKNSAFSVSEAKSWLANHLNANAAGKSVSRASIINPDWEHVISKEDDSYQSLEIPVSFTGKFFLSKSADKAADNSKNVVKYLILKNKKTGELTSVLMNAVSDKKIDENELHYARVSADFSGSIFYLNAETAALISGCEYKDGKTTGTIAGKHTTASEPACTDSDWGIFSTTCYYTPSGGLQYCDEPELLYTYTVTTCSGGNDGGISNPPPPPPNSCQEQAQAFLNAGSAIDDGQVNTFTEYNTGNEWKVVYDWKIFSAGTWGLVSFEKAILHKVFYPGNISRWEYQSFTHDRLAPIGINVGGTRTFHDDGNTINPSPTGMVVWERIDFSTVSTVTGCPWVSPLPQSWNANKIFYAPN